MQRSQVVLHKTIRTQTATRVDFFVRAHSISSCITKLHRMHEMQALQTIVIDVHAVCLSVSLRQSVCQSVMQGSTRLHCEGLIRYSLCQITLASCYYYDKKISYCSFCAMCRNAFRPYRMHCMQAIVTDAHDVCKSVSLSVCLSVTRLRCANTADEIEVLFGVKTLGNLRSILLDEGPSLMRGELGKIFIYCTTQTGS